MTATAVEPTITRPVCDLKVKVVKEILLDALKFIAAIASNRSRLPVLSGAHIQAGPTGTTIAAFDYEVAVRQVIDASGSGVTLVPAKALEDIVKSLTKGATIELESRNGRLCVTGDAVTYTIPELPIDEYPALPTPCETVICDLPVEALARLADVAVAAGRDQTLPVLTGVQFSPEAHTEGKRTRYTLQAAATDRYRLAVYDSGIAVKCKGDKPWSYLLPASGVVAAAKWFRTGPVRLSAGDQRLTWTDGVRTMDVRTLDGEFPRYRSLIPELDAFETRIDVTSKELVKAIRQVALAGTRTSPVRLTATGDHLVLEAGGLGDMEASKHLDIPFEGEPVTWAFNPNYMLDGLMTVGEDVRISVVRPTKPFVLDAPAVDGFRYLLMPVRLAG